MVKRIMLLGLVCFGVSNVVAIGRVGRFFERIFKPKKAQERITKERAALHEAQERITKERAALHEAQERITRERVAALHEEISAKHKDIIKASPLDNKETAFDFSFIRTSQNLKLLDTTIKSLIFSSEMTEKNLGTIKALIIQNKGLGDNRVELMLNAEKYYNEKNFINNPYDKILAEKVKESNKELTPIKKSFLLIQIGAFQN